MENYEKWWLKYPKIAQSLFYLENSGKYLMEPCPYKLRNIDIGLEPSPFNDAKWSIIGYTENPPFTEYWTKNYNYDVIGIMFEKQNGERMWFHFPII